MQEIRIHSAHNHYVKHWIKLKASSSYRDIQGTLLLEGKSSVVDVCTKCEALHLILLENVQAPSNIHYRSLVRVSASIMKKISSLECPEGWLAELPLPRQKIDPLSQKILALDAISDPGNLGTLIRSCLALGWDGIYLLENCCDPFNDKALRAAKGATFRIPLAQGSFEDFLSFVQKKKMNVFLADTEGSPLKSTASKEPLALILSRESQGARKEAKSQFQRVTIPMYGPMESLNVASAGSILLYALRGIL